MESTVDVIIYHALMAIKMESLAHSDVTQLMLWGSQVLWDQQLTKREPIHSGLNNRYRYGDTMP